MWRSSGRRSGGERCDLRRTMASAGLRVLVCALTAGALSGCLGRSPGVRHFVLGSDGLPAQAARAPESSVLVGPVRLPVYLDRPQLARLTASGEIELDEFARWLGGFERNFLRAVSAGLARELGSNRISTHPSTAPFAVDHRVPLHVDELVVDAGGALRARIRWVVLPGPQGGRDQRDASESSRAAPSIELFERAIELDGVTPEAVVRAHMQIVADLAGLIADRIASDSAALAYGVAGDAADLAEPEAGGDSD